MSEIQWQTPEQVAQDPRVPHFNAAKIRQLLRKGTLRGSQVGNRWFVPTGALDEMLEAHTNQPRAKKKRAAV
jgi:hypothetical protein